MMLTENIDLQKTIAISEKRMKVCKSQAARTLYKVIVLDKTTKHLLLFGNLSCGFSRN